MEKKKSENKYKQRSGFGVKDKTIYYWDGEGHITALLI